jgi:hypothetical protein
MGTINSLGSERAAVIAVIDPDVTAASTVTSAYVGMDLFNQVMAVVMAGTLGSSATLDFKLVQATDSSGTSSKDITGKAITQLTQGGTDNSDDQAIINCRAEELDVDNGFSHVAMTMTVGTATSDAGAILLGMASRFAPASDNDVASVQEIVS